MAEQRQNNFSQKNYHFLLKMIPTKYRKKGFNYNKNRKVSKLKYNIGKSD